MLQNSSSQHKVLFAIFLPAWVLAGFILSQEIIGGILRLLIGAGISFESFNETVFNSVAQGIVYLTALALVIGVPWLLQRRRTSFKDVGLQRAPDLPDIGWAPVAMVIYYILSAIVLAVAMVLAPDINYTQAQETGFTGISTQLEYVLAFVSLVIIAPVAEEVLFRGYLLGKLRKHVTSWLAVLIVSVLFGYLHGQWNVALDTFALSVVLCVLRLKTGSLWAPILVHAMKNGIAFYLLFINPSLIGTIGG